MLLTALSRAVADRVTLSGVTVGRKGLQSYLKALGGSNIVKVAPSNGSASESQIAARLKVVCGPNVSFLDDGAWIADKTPQTFCEVRVSPSYTVKPNVGTTELAQAIARVLPFTAENDTRPVLQCVKFEASDGKLTLVSSDGFALAVTTLDYDDGEGQVLVNRDDLKGIVNALKRARRARVGFEVDANGHTNLIVETELVRYKWLGWTGTFPNYTQLIPTEFSSLGHFDTVEATKAANSLQALQGSRKAAIDLTIGDGKMVMSSPDDKGQAELPTNTDGDVMTVRLDGRYLIQALKACGGMVELRLKGRAEPTVFDVDGYQLVIMPMITPTPQAKGEAEAVAEAEAIVQKSEPRQKPKRKRKPKAEEPVQEPVAVA